MKDRIKNLLASGMKPVDVCSVVGCSPAYVSQLLKDEDFKKSVEDHMIAQQSEKTEEEHLDTKYQTVEQKLLISIEQGIADADFKEKLRALEVVAKRQNERSKIKMPAPALPHGGGTSVNLHITQIALPAHAHQNAPVVTLNEKNEIIAIDNKPLAPMSSTGVKGAFEKIMAIRKEQAIQVAAQNAALSEV